MVDFVESTVAQVKPVLEALLLEEGVRAEQATMISTRVTELLVTADEVPDPHTLRVQLRLNGQTMQDSNTREFIFRVPHLLHFLSQVVTLEPGHLIFTGTPPGVGIARKPPVLLKPGDVAEVEVERLGVLRNPVVAE